MPVQRYDEEPSENIELGMFRLPLTGRTPKAVRDLVAKIAESWGLEEIEYQIKLAVSELVTNALIHADPTPGATVTAMVTRVGKQFRVAVHDGSTCAPQIRHPADTEESGRGLILVEDVTDTCGFYLTPFGKTVWFEIAADWPLNIGGI